jgi:hypothetical protein
MPGKTRNVFISHVHEDDPGLGSLKNLLAKQGVEIRDSSITAENPNDANDPEYIKREILGPRIRWAGVLLVYITAETRESPWVNWEIEYAEKNGKPIVGIWAHGAKDEDLPRALDDYADAVVAWNSDSIASAINGELRGWWTANGAPRGTRSIPRYHCR